MYHIECATAESSTVVKPACIGATKMQPELGNDFLSPVEGDVNTYFK